MKLRPVTKLDKRNTEMSKKVDNDIMLTNCDVIIFIPINVQFPSIRSPIPDAWSIKLPFSLTITFYFKKSPKQLSYYSFE